MHRCQFVTQINDYFDNRLADLSRAKFEEHLKVCLSCSGEVRRAKELVEQLKAWQASGASDGFENSVRNKIVAWELERSAVKMKIKPFSILVPAGVCAGIIAFMLAGQVLVKRGFQGGLKEPADKRGEIYSPATSERLYSRDLRKTDVSSESVLFKGGKEERQVDYVYNKMTGGFENLSAPSLPVAQSEFFEEDYSRLYDNDFLVAKDNPLSTFSIDVDTASYANTRRFLSSNQLPPQDAVRTEEMVNYFTYDYPQPTGSDPFSINTEASVCPWNAEHKLVLIGLQGKKMEVKDLPASNLVFLIDVSGSMQDTNKLPLLKSAFRLLVNQLRPQDKVSIVTYAGSSGVVLDSVSGAQKDRIMQAIDGMEAGGSTAGAQGITMAYEIAKKNFNKVGNNRVILATDGDFNVGITRESELVRLIEERRDEGIFLTVLGFGVGNYKDAKMEKLADKGNGNFAYIDNLLEGKKVFVTQLTGTLWTIAKDVKIQVEFNPTQIKAYRLIGYENRKLENKDFNDDKKDAGELGAGHTVTALYEVVPIGSKEEFAKIDDLKYQQAAVIAPSGELLTVKLRYKDPGAEVSKLLSKVINVKEEILTPSENFRFASSVAEFGLLLRNSPYKANASYQSLLERARSAKGADIDGYRADLIKLVEIAQMLDSNNK